VSLSTTTFTNGTHTTVFATPPPSAGFILYRRLRASASPIASSSDVVEFRFVGGVEFELKSAGNEGWNVIVEYSADLGAGDILAGPWSPARARPT